MNNKSDKILLDLKAIRAYLNYDLPLDLFQTLDSTSDYLKKLKPKSSIRFCLTERQTAGRGRFKNTWHSPFGENFYGSLLYPLEKTQLEGLSLAVGLGMIQCIEGFISPPKKLGLKWPNDILYRGKKLGGILIETVLSHGKHWAIIGIGINLNMLSIPSEAVTQAWTSLSRIMGCFIDRNRFTAMLINQLMLTLSQFKQYGFSSFLNDWAARDILYKKKINLRFQGKIYRGKMFGVDHQGYLRLKLEDGLIKRFASGEASKLIPHP